MCSIFLSNRLDRFQDLIRLNQSRGKFSYSYSTLKNGKFTIVKKDFGLFDESILDPEAPIHIGHCQAPTGGLDKSIDRIHPSEIEETYLYHNGILKPEYLKSHNYSGWDTKFLHSQIIDLDKRIDSLESIQGSFACLFVKENRLHVFRNSLCPLYFQDREELSISSVMFPTSSPFPPRCVGVNIGMDKLTTIGIWEEKFNQVYIIK